MTRLLNKEFTLLVGVVGCWVEFDGNDAQIASIAVTLQGMVCSLSDGGLLFLLWFPELHAAHCHSFLCALHGLRHQQTRSVHDCIKFA